MSRARCSAQGFKLPLLIGGATTSRAHTAVKIAPHYAGPGGLRAGRLAQRVGVCSSLLSRRAARDAIVAEVRADYERIRDAARATRRARTAASARRGARQRGRKTDWTQLRAAGAAAHSGVTRAAGTTRSPSWSTTSTGRRSSRPGSWPGRIRRSCTTRWSARRRASVLRRGAGDAGAHRATSSWLTRERRVRPVPGQHA